MFGFEKLEVYNLAHRQYVRINQIISGVRTDATNADAISALRVSSLEMLQYFVKGSFHIEALEKKKYYTESRGAVFQSVALMRLLRDISPSLMNEEQYTELYNNFESLSRMMLTLIKNRSSFQSGKPLSVNKGDGVSDKSSFGEEDSLMFSTDGDDFMNFNKLEIGE